MKVAVSIMNISLFSSSFSTLIYIETKFSFYIDKSRKRGRKEGDIHYRNRDFHVDFEDILINLIFYKLFLLLLLLWVLFI